MEYLILKYLEGTASNEEKQTLLKWIRENESNKNEFHEIRDLWITTGNVLSETSGSQEAFSRFKQNVDDYEDAGQQKRTWVRILKYAASVAVLIVCSVGMYMLGSRRWENESFQTVVNQTIVRNEKTYLLLPDGTKVWLNKDSKISYPDSFSDKQRVVTLEGEGYFEVVHDETSPFFVETKGMTVRVLGTMFDVKNYSSDVVSETVLLSGKVEVYMEKCQEPILLSPDQKVSYDKQTGDYRVANVDAPEYALWKNDKLVMDNEELEAIFKKIGRWYDVDIVYDRNLPLKTRYSVTITDEPKEEILRLLSIISPVKYKIENNQIIISRK
ncbi:MAG: DUF4974 domain-containing protein [Tannerella sp.]|jgi:ferric-dicitrate binding protein FerR (iron transport regulator)|nr:DUF4974 domain-containing protein [Tannerella sp.]